MGSKPDDLMQRLMDAKNPETGAQMSDEQLEAVKAKLTMHAEKK